MPIQTQSRPIDVLRSAVQARREAMGLCVRIAASEGRDEWRGCFADIESRDDFIRRARLNGLHPEIV